MNSELYSRFKFLSEKMNDFYDQEYLSEEGEYIENKKIKSDIIDFIVKSNELSEFSLVQNALLLLFENTGCQEDFEILNEIITPLFENNILDNKSLKKYFVTLRYQDGNSKVKPGKKLNLPGFLLFNSRSGY